MIWPLWFWIGYFCIGIVVCVGLYVFTPKTLTKLFELDKPTSGDLVVTFFGWPVTLLTIAILTAVHICLYKLKSN